MPPRHPMLEAAPANAETGETRERARLPRALILGEKAVEPWILGDWILGDWDHWPGRERACVCERESVCVCV